MANHLRRQIREAIATAVTGLATTGARVFQSRIYPLATTDLPGLRVTTHEENVDASQSLPAPRIIQRRLEVRITALARATADLDDTLDGICKEVEIALAMPCAALAGLAKVITLASTSIDWSGDAEQPVGSAAMTYEVIYMNAENAPDVAY